MVAVLVGEAVDLVFDARAVARADALDHAGEHRRAVEVGADDVVGAAVGAGDPARQLARVLAGLPRKLNTGTGSSPGCSSITEKSIVRASRRGGVPVFRRPGAASSFRRWPRLIAGGSPGAAGGVVLHPDVDQAVEEGAGGEHHRGRLEAQADLVTTPVTRSPTTVRSSTACWNSQQVGLVLEAAADRGLVKHRSAWARVARTAGPLLALRMRNWMPPSSVARHGAAEGVHLLHQMPLADAADGRVAAHLAEGFDVVGEQGGASGPRRRSGFGAGMAAADNDHVESGGVAWENREGGSGSRMMAGPCAAKQRCAPPALAKISAFTTAYRILKGPEGRRQPVVASAGRTFTGLNTGAVPPLRTSNGGQPFSADRSAAWTLVFCFVLARWFSPAGPVQACFLIIRIAAFGRQRNQAEAGGVGASGLKVRVP